MKDQNSLKQNTLKKSAFHMNYGERENKCVLKDNKIKEKTESRSSDHWQKCSNF